MPEALGKIMFIQTVNGQIPPDQLGLTLSHEHIMIDYRESWVEPPSQFSHLSESPVTTELIEDVRLHAHSSKDNLILDDEDLAVTELLHFKQFGGNAVVELSSTGLSLDPQKLRRISQKTDLNIVVGCGYYRHFAQPKYVLEKKAAEITEQIIKSLKDGIGGTDVRGGIIGEIGTSYPLHPFELESLMASARAQCSTGFPINIHPEILSHEHLNLLNIVEDAGADLTRVVMSHMDEPNDFDWMLKVAQRGVYISFDTFGYDFPFDGIEKPKDMDRVKCLLKLLDAGYLDKVLLSHDICYKMQQKSFGGPGYSHILENIVPLLKNSGVSEEEISKILIDNPKKLLAVDAPC
jgi:phosphotriesterase-related protein